ncbi:MAG: 16S rRNA (cytidine(1402)-2'-O)-methyltransferase [Bryobacteraceae bacterium]|nr:16S rRNA (cytidine(1402)-2'-O)-methyltransferase [Bryobacteraceae bacterium]
MSQGILYIVATPIGNLGDITFRAVQTLRDVDRIACEDTRHTRKLLDHYGIEKPLLSFHEFNERDRTGELLDRLRSGEKIALVSDAGTPLISDPGYRIVEAATRENVSVVTIPGPSAAVAALSASGLPTDSFYFGGFLPARSSHRRRTLASVAELDCVLIFYEAPHRLIEALEDLAEVFGDRPIVVARELTKMHEEFARGSAITLIENFRARVSVKGEVTLLIGKPPERIRELGSIRGTFERHLETGMARMDAMKATARDCGVSKREVYAELEKEP